MNRQLLIPILLVALVAIGSAYGQMNISVTNGETQGRFGPMEFCPGGSNAIGFRTQQDGFDLPVVDDTATNSIALICNDPAQSNVTSTQGFVGDWLSPTFCPREGDCLTAFTLRVVPFGVNATDEVAVTNIHFRCTNGREVIPPTHPGQNGGEFGTFSPECPVNSCICGISTRVRPSGGGVVDDTALNDVQFQCCNAMTTIPSTAVPSSTVAP